MNMPLKPQSTQVQSQPKTWVFDRDPRISQDDGVLTVKADPVFTEIQWLAIWAATLILAVGIPLLIHVSFDSASSRIVFAVWCATCFLGPLAIMKFFPSILRIDDKSRTLSISTGIRNRRKVQVPFDDIFEVSVSKVFSYKGIERVDIDVAHFEFKQGSQFLQACGWLLGAALLCVDPSSMDLLLSHCERNRIQIRTQK